MPLSPQAALSKDMRASAPMQHRHFATIASSIRKMDPEVRLDVATHFSERLVATNAKFDRLRFLAACGYEADTLQVMRMIDQATS